MAMRMLQGDFRNTPQPLGNKCAELDPTLRAWLYPRNCISAPISAARTRGQTGLPAQPDHGLSFLAHQRR